MLRIYGAREYNGNIKIDVGIEYNFKIGWKVLERLETSLDRSRKSIDKEYRMTNEREKVSSSIPKVHFIDDNKDDTLSSIKTTQRGRSSFQSGSVNISFSPLIPMDPLPTNDPPR